MNQESLESRAARNTAYLSKVFGTNDLDEARECLESSMPSGVECLDVLDVALDRQHDERSPLESLDLLIRDPAGAGLTAGDHDRLEAIIHETGRPAYVIDNGSFAPSGEWASLGLGDARKKIETAIPSVGRIEVPHDHRPYAGTGFVVGENLLMTNRHVARIFALGTGTKHLKFEAGQIAGIDFMRELPAANKPDPVFLPIKDVVMIHPYWDMALLRTASDLEAMRSPLKLSVMTPQELAQRKVAAIGYPAKDPRNNLKVQEQIFGGRYQIKRLLPGRHDGAVVYRGQNVMAHDTSTLGGAWGSAVLDIESGEVVGLHFAGEYMVSNYAVPSVSLAEDQRILDLGLNFVGAATVKTSFYAPFWSHADKGGDETEPVDIKEQRDSHEGRTTPDVDPHIERFKFASLRGSQFSWEAALSTALASYVAYLDESQIRQTCDVWQLSGLQFIARDNTECFVVGDSETALVAFRGTEKKVADWLTDLNFIGTTKTYGRVHRGFWAAFQAVADLVNDAIASLGSPELVLTGHSLGGALALIAAAELKGKHSVRSIYTYGQPAVGKGRHPEFMQANFGRKFFRFVNNDDIVTKVPPTYRHTGELYRFGPDSNLMPEAEAAFNNDIPTTMSEVQFDNLRLEMLKRKLNSAQAPADTEEGWIPSFRDHSMARYIEKIASNLK